MNRQTLIIELTKIRVLGKNLKSSRLSKQRLYEHPRLLNALVNTTSYLDANASIYERLLNLRLGITSIPRCEFCNKSLSGKYQTDARIYPRFCPPKCRHLYVTSRRIAAIMADGSKIAKQMAKNSIKTQRKNGSLEKRIAQTLKTKREIGLCVPEDQVTEYQKYRSLVSAITNKQPIHLLENIEKRGSIETGGWHLDHIYSVKAGFINTIPPEIIGHILNLRVIPGHLNVKKQDRCDIDIDELTEKYQASISADVSNQTLRSSALSLLNAKSIASKSSASLTVK